MDSRDPSFEQNDSPAVLPITVHVSDNSSVSSNTPVQLSQAQPLSTEEFHLVDQNGQPLYELQSLGDSSTQMVSTYKTTHLLSSQKRNNVQDNCPEVV